MSEKSLKKKAIKIKGKDYVLVADRILYFNETYPNGSIQTKLLEDNHDITRVVIKAIVTPDVGTTQRIFTGYSQAVWGDGYINKTSALENAETSAVGRALAMMGIGVVESIASVDEINKAKSTTEISPELERAPVCEKCGSIGIKAKRPNGSVFWTCPHWSDHKTEGEKFKMIPQTKTNDFAEKNKDFLPNN